MKKFVRFISLAMVVAAASIAPAAHAGTVVNIGSDTDSETEVCGVPAVPETGTLSLMVVGLGLVGLRLRRKNK